MRTPALTCPSLLVACLLACSADSGGPASEVTGGSTSAAPSTEPATSSTTGDPTTGEATSSTTDATSSTTDAASSTSSTTSSTGEATSSTGTDTGTTGPDGVLGPAALEAMDALEQAVAGVLYSSESDYPWTVVGFADAAPVSEANVKDVIAAVYVPHEGQAPLADRVIEVRTLAQLIDPLTTPQDWWDDSNKMVAAQYTEIRAVLEAKLVDIQVFRIGELSGNVLQGAVDIYVLGSTADGDVVGMWTVSIET